MNLLMVELLIIAVLTSVVCALPGVFLVLRGASLMSDAMSHALLLGIVVMFLWVRSLTSPLLLIGAGIAGFGVVVLTEYIMQCTRLSKDAAIGLLFPLFFSCAVVLISLYTRDVHLDTDMVLLGDLVFAPFSRCIIAGTDCGSYAVCILMVLLIFVTGIFCIGYPRLLLVLFDPLYAHTVQAQPSSIYYGMMGLTSVVAVAVFSVVGSVIVVALMIAPAASAFCTARSLKQMLVHAAGYGVCAAVFGYGFAAWQNVSIAGSIATMSGLLFAIIVLSAPRMGIIGRICAYGVTWLVVSVAMVECLSVQYQENTISWATAQKVYGWSHLWATLVRWYALWTGAIISLGGGLYAATSHNAHKDLNL